MAHTHAHKKYMQKCINDKETERDGLDGWEQDGTGQDIGMGTMAIDMFCLICSIVMSCRAMSCIKYLLLASNASIPDQATLLLPSLPSKLSFIPAAQIKKAGSMSQGYLDLYAVPHNAL